MRDTLIIRNLAFVGRHGVYDEERAEGRRFEIDVEMDLLVRGAQTGDLLGNTVDYRDIARAILEVGNGPSVHLIETMAERMCGRILDLTPLVRQVRLTLRKYATGVPGDPEWVGLRVVRDAPPLDATD